jgi:3-oxoacyl-[acyl-carrier-protein] synthase-3
MGARIESVAVVSSHARLIQKGGLRLADDAARSCLEHAGRSPADVDLLINAGIYHDENLGEPALAALIQEDIGANPVQAADRAHGTFSFDVVNSGAGVITAFHLLDGFLSSSIDLGLVVASDADPGSAVEPEFPFPSVGGAALLARAEPDRGFQAFRFETFPEFQQLFSARIHWEERRLRRGHNVLEIQQDPGYRARTVECATEATRRFLDSLDVRARSLDLLVPSQFPVGFADELARRLELRTDRVAHVGEDFTGAHTAGPLAALSTAERDGRFGAAQLVLFVAAGSGISVGLALYRL